jgi:hypothetical protein
MRVRKQMQRRGDSGRGASAVRLGVALLLAALPRAGAAQGREGDGGRQRDPNAWGLTIGLSSSINSNIRYTANGGIRGLVTRFNGGFARTQNVGGISLKASGQAAALVHGSSLSDLNRGTYAGQVSATGKLWRGAGFNVADQMAFTYNNDARDLGDLDDPTLALRLTSTRRNVVQGGMSQQIGRRSGMNLHGSYRTTSFPDAADLVGGKVYAGSTSFTTAIGRVGAVSLGYAYSYSSNRRADAEVHSGSIGYSRPLGRSFTMGLTAGASRIATLGETPIRGTGEVSLAYTPRTGRFGLRVSRHVSQAIGFGRERVADRASLSYSRPLTRNLSWSVNTAYSISRDPVDPSFENRSQSAGTSFAYPIGKHIGLAGAYTFVRNDAGNGRILTSHSGSLAMAFHTTFR